MWLVAKAGYKKGKVSNSSSGMNKCASVTLRAKDVQLGIYLKYPVGGRANGTITKNNVRLADLKAKFYGVLNGFDYSLTPKRSCKTWVRLPGTPGFKIRTFTW